MRQRQSKFGKRKYHRRKRVEGVWIFGGIERETKQWFLSDRSTATLIPIIQNYVEPGTTIHSDSLEKEGCIQLQLTMNHSIQTKKQTHGCLHKFDRVDFECCEKKSQKHFYDGYLVEYCVRKKDKFLTFLNLTRKVYTCTRRLPLKQKVTNLTAV